METDSVPPVASVVADAVVVAVDTFVVVGKDVDLDLAVGLGFLQKVKDGIGVVEDKMDTGCCWAWSR